MEKQYEKVYQEMTEYYRKENESLITNLDLLQSAIVRVIETKKEFNDTDHFKNYLKSAVRTGRIDVNQQRENLVSLSTNDKETGLESYQVSIPEKDYHLYILKQSQKPFTP